MARIAGRRKAKPKKAALPQNPLQAMLPPHLEWMQVRQYSENTVETRRHQLGVFLRWCDDRGLESPHEITRPVLEHYQRYLFHYRQRNGRPLSFRTQHGMLVPLRGWFRWMTRQNHILHNPASELELPRLGHHLPKQVLTVEEVEIVLQQPNISEPMGLRDRAIMETLYSTGIRRGELIQLKLYDTDVRGGTLFIRQGKGKKDRVVPIGERAVKWIEKYLREVRPELAVEPDDMTLFLSQHGEALSRDHLSGMVHDYMLNANIGKGGGPHLFRHTMATLMLENGAGLRFIQEILGHEKISTTQIYTHVSIRRLKQIHNATHPAAYLQRTGAAQENDAQERGELSVPLAHEDHDED
ncbi:MAG: site-specific tyrosine recombinase XerC [Candidatus Sulfotelmatobacter sp.]